MTTTWIDESVTLNVLGQPVRCDVTLTINGHHGHLRIVANGVEIEDSYGDQSSAYPKDSGLRGAALRACHKAKARDIAESSVFSALKCARENEEWEYLSTVLKALGVQ